MWCRHAIFGCDLLLITLRNHIQKFRILIRNLLFFFCSRFEGVLTSVGSCETRVSPPFQKMHLPEPKSAFQEIVSRPKIILFLKISHGDLLRLAPLLVSE